MGRPPILGFMDFNPVPQSLRRTITTRHMWDGDLLYVRVDLGGTVTARAHSIGRPDPCGHGDVDTWCVHIYDGEGLFRTTRHTNFELANAQAVKHAAEFGPDGNSSPFSDEPAQPATNAIDRLEELVYHHDGELAFSMQSRGVWRGQLRLAMAKPESLRRRSVAFSAATDHGPEEVAEVLLADAEAWLAETDSEPPAPSEDD
jgi:hypothetical protein